MTNLRTNQRGRGRFLTSIASIALTTLVAFASDSSVCRGQIAGFAQSRATVAPSRSFDAGSNVRNFVSGLNPFKRETSTNAETANDATATAYPANVRVVTPSSPTTANGRVASARSSASYGRTVPSAAASSAIPTGATVGRVATVASARPTSRALGTTSATSAKRPRSASGVLGARKSSTGGVATRLLDEFEEELGDSPFALADDSDDAFEEEETRVVRKRPARRSLRSDELDSMELLDDAADDESEDDETVLATDEEEEEDEFDDEEDAEDEEEIEGDEPEEEAEEETATFDSDAGPAIPVETKASVRSTAKKTTAARTAARSAAKPVAQEPTREPTRVANKPVVVEAREENDVDRALDRALAARKLDSSAAVEKLEPTSRWSGDEEIEGGEGDAIVANEAAPSNAAGRAPIVEVDSLGPSKLVVGQSSAYKVRVRNSGAVAANGLTVTTELPEFVVATTPSVSVGRAALIRADEAGARVRRPSTGAAGEEKKCVWNVGTLAAGAECELTLNLTPTKRSAFELVSEFEYDRASARANVEVGEPILEASVEGRDAIEYGVGDKYRLRLRNVGNADAEDVRLAVSTGENEASQTIGTLRAGEEKTIEISVKTEAEGTITIDAKATGAYGLAATASKKIAVLRGKLDVAVEAPELLFVDGEVQAVVRVRNLGDATLQNVEVVAQAPEAVEVVACSGNARRNEEKGRVYWTIPMLRAGEETTFTIDGRPTVAGAASFAVVGKDASGTTAQSETTAQVESIAALAMRVEAPKGPVAVGKECVYELRIENNGTKAARDVESGVFLGAGLVPLEVEEGRGVVDETDSKALFEKIDELAAGETVVFRVRAKAVAAGNHKVQAMMRSIPEDARLLREETTYCYDRTGTRDKIESLDKKPTFVATEADAEPRRK